MNYQHLFLLFVIVVLAACQQDSVKEVNIEEDIMPQFTTYFEPLTIQDTMMISHWEWGEEEVDSTLFGNAIPYDIVTLLFDSVTLASMNSPQDFYGLYTLNHAGQTGYIFRTRISEMDYMQETYLFWRNEGGEWSKYAKIAGFVGAPGFTNQTRSWWTADSDTLKATIRNYNFVVQADGAERVEDVVFEFLFKGDQLETKEYPAEEQFRLKKIYDMN